MRCDGPAGASAPAAAAEFFSGLGKILILLELRRGYLLSSAQNLGSKRLTGKILQNKELAEPVDSASGASDRLWFGRTISIVRFLFSRSRLYVTKERLFVVENCGKSLEGSLVLQASPNGTRVQLSGSHPALRTPGYFHRSLRDRSHDRGSGRTGRFPQDAAALAAL